MSGNAPGLGAPRLRVVAHTETLREQIANLNRRLEAAGEPSRFPVSPPPALHARKGGDVIPRESFVAVDQSAAVRGGYLLKHQDFWLDGEVLSLAHLGMPLSEGVVDRRFAHLASLLVRDAERRKPLLFGLGMGGAREPVARLLRAAGWKMFPVPFFFRVVRPYRFLRNVTYLRTSPLRRAALDLAALSGLGWLGLRAWQQMRCPRPAGRGGLHCEIMDDFGPWADQLWKTCREHYRAVAVRDVATLEVLYPLDDVRFIRLKVAQQGRTVGWAVLLCTQLSGHKQFGAMRLGSLVDCLAVPADAVKVVAAARSTLERRGADLVVSNQSHGAWCGALKAAGFLTGPSNFLFAPSPALGAKCQAAGIRPGDWHLNRGDGDGPINL